MKIAMISDMHHQLDFTIKKSDILLIAGDSLPATRDIHQSCLSQENFLKKKFYPWVENQPVDEVIFIAGNHDWIFERMSNLVPPMPSKLHYLEDSEITIKGLRIYGTPQQPIFLNWAFNKTSEQLERYFDEIPEGLDILLCHTAPYGIMDNVKNEWSSGNFGCKVLLDRIKKVKPKYVVFGHFHGNDGIEKNDDIKGTTFVNCSLIDERYIMTKKPIYIEIEK